MSSNPGQIRNVCDICRCLHCGQSLVLTFDAKLLCYLNILDISRAFLSSQPKAHQIYFSHILPIIILSLSGVGKLEQALSQVPVQVERLHGAVDIIM